MLKFQAEDKYFVSDRGTVFTGYWHEKWVIDTYKEPDWLRKYFYDKEIEITYEGETKVYTIKSVEVFLTMVFDLSKGVGFLVK